MSIKRILAAAAASVVAVSAMAVAASADALLTSVISGESGKPVDGSNAWVADLTVVGDDNLAKVESVVATITSTAYVNGSVGGNTSAGSWGQSAQQENASAATNEWKWEGIGGLAAAADGALQVQLWWQNVNDDGSDSTVTVDKVVLLDADGNTLYTYGDGAAATPDEKPDEKPEETKPEETKPEEKPEESKTEDTTTKPNVDTGVEGVAAVVGVAAVAIGAMVVAKKRK